MYSFLCCLCLCFQIQFQYRVGILVWCRRWSKAQSPLLESMYASNECFVDFNNRNRGVAHSDDPCGATLGTLGYLGCLGCYRYCSASSGSAGGAPLNLRLAEASAPWRPRIARAPRCPPQPLSLLVPRARGGCAAAAPAAVAVAVRRPRWGAGAGGPGWLTCHGA